MGSSTSTAEPDTLSPPLLPLTVLTHVVKDSSNPKIGKMAATYRNRESCPTTCPFMRNGCYADGRIFAISEKYGTDKFDNLLALEHSIRKDGAIRLNVSGDFLDVNEQPDWDYINACNELAHRRPDIAFISYTHAWRQLSPSDFGFTVNASCETPEDLTEAMAAGWQAVVVDDGTLVGSKVADRNVLQCPQQYREGVTCDSCRACAADTPTRPVIAFLIHGATRNKAKKSLATQREGT